jgi:hypothetical protein
MEHRLAGLDEGGKVEDAVKGCSLGFGGGEKLIQSGPVCQLSLDKIDTGGYKVAPAMAQIVKNDGMMPILSQ